MDAIVIAGGRGKRLGSLTSHHNKGALRFFGVPILVRVVNSLCEIPTIERIHIVTGHKYDSIGKVSSEVTNKHDTSISVIQGPEETVGMLQRIALAVTAVQSEFGAFVMGIDSLIEEDVMASFVSTVMSHVADGKNDLTLLCATDINPAPTHYLIHEHEGVVIRHLAPANADESCTLRSVGVRYLPKVLLDIARDAPQWYGKNISPYITHRMLQGMTVRSVIMREPWVHIGYPKDFGKSES